jgi:hypothetical protein
LPRARWWASLTAQSWAHLVNGTTALSGTAPGPQCAQSRTATQRARALGIAAGSDHIGNLQSTVLLAVLPALRIRADHPQRRALSQYSTSRRARAGTSSALSLRTCSLNARKQPQTHFEPHDRLADHREQPRRQREQLRRELSVRHTGSHHRWRLPVPREQHRHEQLEPLRQYIRSFSRTRALDPCVPQWQYTTRVRREYPWSGP